jgi:hypothetical protein
MLVQRRDRVTWGSEACDRYYDPESDAKVIQITSSPQCSVNIYCEQPYCTPDGKRFAFLRRPDTTVFENTLMVADLTRLYVAPIDFGVIGVFNAAYSGIVYYYTSGGSLKRVNLSTLEKEEVPLGFDPDLRGRGASVSSDGRYIICYEPQGDSHGIKRIDLLEQKADVIFEHPELCNPHVQFNPVHGRDILVQFNRGSVSNKDKVKHKPVDLEKGVTHFLIDRAGGNRRDLPLGPPYTASSTGHAAWIGDSGRVVCTTAFDARDEFRYRHDPRTPEGNIVSAAPGDEAPSPFRAPDLFTNHISVSRCGRYFVVDSWPGSLFDERKQGHRAGVVIGCLSSGRYRTLLVDSMSSGGGGEHNHVHAYLTGDNRHVVYNANPFYSATQVFVARLPEGFLESLN